MRGIGFYMAALLFWLAVYAAGDVIDRVSASNARGSVGLVHLVEGRR
jgi:hypothetical protein